MRFGLLAAILLSLPASAVHADEAVRPLERTQATLSLGAFGAGVSYETTSSSDPLFLGAVDGTAMLLDDRLVLDGWIAAGLPLRSGGMRSAYTTAIRAGWRFESVSFAVGPTLNFAPGSPALGWLPSLTLKARIKGITGVLGVFDRFGTVPARLGIETEYWGASFLAAYGAEVWGRLPIAETFALEARGFAYRLIQYGMLGATVGVRWSPE